MTSHIFQGFYICWKEFIIDILPVLQKSSDILHKLQMVELMQRLPEEKKKKKTQQYI